MSENKKKTAIDFVFEILKDKHPLAYKALRDDNVDYLAKVLERDIIVDAAIYEPFLGDQPRTVGKEYYEQHFGDLEPPN